MDKGKNIAKEKSFDFAVRVVKLYRFLCDNKKEYVLAKQLLRSGTSVGANIAEALQGQSKKDFLSKISIALKEAHETQYWIELLFASDIIDENQKRSILKDCGELIAILTATVKTTRQNIIDKKGKQK